MAQMSKIIQADSRQHRYIAASIMTALPGNSKNHYSKNAKISEI